MSSPDAYDISGGPVTVDFDVATVNLTNTTQTVALNFSAHHILTYNGVNVADGQPGQPGITFTGPAGTTQALMPGSQAFTETWAPNANVAIARTYNFNACGYYQLDIWAPVKPSGEGGRDRATLASGFIRVLGCQGDRHQHQRRPRHQRLRQPRHQHQRLRRRRLPLPRRHRRQPRHRHPRPPVALAAQPQHPQRPAGSRPFRLVHLQPVQEVAGSQLEQCF